MFNDCVATTSDLQAIEKTLSLLNNRFKTY